MTRIDEHLERLIVRSLDGVLNADEELELNRQLIRDPAALRLMEAYRAVDSLAGAALETVITDQSLAFDPAGPASPPAPARCRRIHRGWWLVPGAIAAALLGLIVPMPDWNAGIPGKSNHPNGLAQRPTPLVLMQPFEDGGDNVMRPVRSGPTVHRDTGRDVNVIGVVGDDGNLYWIEVERTRTITRPKDDPQAGGRINEM